MRNVLVTLITTLTLLGCSDPGETPPPAASQKNTDQSKITIQNDDKATVYFSDGSGILFSAHSSNEEILEGKNGRFQRYILQIAAEIMILEQSTFDALEKSGYTRRILKNEPPIYTVNYIKPGHPTILATYKKLSLRKGGTPNTQLVLTWRIKS